MQDRGCWAVGRIVVLSCLSGDLCVCWMLGCLDVKDAVLCCFASRRYSSAGEEPQLHLCMHRQTNTYVHFLSCRNHIFTLCRVPSVFKHTHLLPMHVHCSATYHFRALLQGDEFHRVFVGLLVGLLVCLFFNSLITLLMAKFPPNLQLPFSCVTYLSWNQLCSSVYLSTLANHGSSVFIFILFP